MKKTFTYVVFLFAAAACFNAAGLEGSHIANASQNLLFAGK